MTISGNALLSAIMLAIFSAMLILAVGYPPEARLMPMTVGFAGTGLCLVQLWQSLSAGRRTKVGNASLGAGIGIRDHQRSRRILYHGRNHPHRLF